MAGKNGSVTSISSDSGGATSVKVHYPDDPGPPSVAAHDEVYTNVNAAQERRFQKAFDKDWFVDCDGTAPDAGTVTLHK